MAKTVLRRAVEPAPSLTVPSNWQLAAADAAPGASILHIDESTKFSADSLWRAARSAFAESPGSLKKFRRSVILVICKRGTPSMALLPPRPGGDLWPMAPPYPEALEHGGGTHTRAGTTGGGDASLQRYANDAVMVLSWLHLGKLEVAPLCGRAGAPLTLCSGQRCDVLKRWRAHGSLWGA